MEILSREDLKKIVSFEGGPCVSLFMPTIRAGKETRQNAIRFKNLLTEAQSRLSLRGLDKRARQDFLRPVKGLLEDSRFWQHQSDGLAVFLSRDLFSFYRIPVELKELTVVADRFHIKPLLMLFVGDGRFYILALSQDMVKLFQATQYKIDELSVEGLPSNMDEALGYDSLEKQVQFHTGTKPRRSRRDAMFHGHGAGTHNKKGFIVQYFRKIDGALHSVLHEDNAHLVVAAVDYLLPLYKEANTYPYLLDEPISGSPEPLKPDELRSRGWKIVAPFFAEEKQKALETYRRSAVNDKASHLLGKIIPAAVQGRVDTLFVAVGIQKWGTFDPETHRLKTRRRKKPEDADLLDYAAVHTLMNGGRVYAVRPEDVPDGGSLAAIFRY